MKSPRSSKVRGHVSGLGSFRTGSKGCYAKLQERPRHLFTPSYEAPMFRGNSYRRVVRNVNVRNFRIAVFAEPESVSERGSAEVTGEEEVQLGPGSVFFRSLRFDFSQYGPTTRPSFRSRFRSFRFKFAQHSATTRPSRRKDCRESIYAFGSRLVQILYCSR